VVLQLVMLLLSKRVGALPCVMGGELHSSLASELRHKYDPSTQHEAET
jgi:hypothetical protein